MSTSDPSITPPKTYIPKMDVAAHFNLPKKTAVLLHPRCRPVPDPFASKLGGRPAWPSDAEWPNCSEHNCPYVPVVQLRKADVPELPFPPRTDLFNMLWCPEDHEETVYGPIVATFWRTASEIGSVRPPPFHGEYYNRSQVPAECALFPERVQETDSEVGDLFDAVNDWVQEKAIDDFEELKVPGDCQEYAYESMFSSSPGTKVGGYVSVIQNFEPNKCACGSNMTLMLSISSSDIGDVVSGYRWAPSDVRRLGNGKLVLDSIKGSNLCLGDMGIVYIFVCEQCESLPVWVSFQCC